MTKIQWKIKRKTIPKGKRRAIWIKHIGSHIFTTNCLSCGSTPIDPFSFESGHIIAHSKGGSTHINNLIPICSICNKDMGVIDMRVYMKQEYNRTLDKILQKLQKINKKIQNIIDN